MQVIKLKRVIALTSLSSATIYRLIKNGEFPKQLKLAKSMMAAIGIARINFL